MPGASGLPQLEDFAALGRTGIWACTQPCHTRNVASLICFCEAYLIFFHVLSICTALLLLPLGC